MILKSVLKHLRYARYILRHKWYVTVECWKRGLYWRGLTHDLSKFLPDEWNAYANWFYTDWGYTFNGGFLWEFDRYAEYSQAFSVAWLKHQHRNPHHWQWWLLQEDDGEFYTIPMDKTSYTEMVCDWIGAGRAIKGTNDPAECLEWYKKNRSKQKMHQSTRDAVDAMLGLTPAMLHQQGADDGCI